MTALLSMIVSIGIPQGYEHLTYADTGQRITTIRLHKKAAESLQLVLIEVQQVGLAHKLETFWGCYNDRDVIGQPGKPSKHKYGLACDFNSDKLPLGSNYRLDQRVVNIFKKYGWAYGGDWEGRPDPMHFEFRGGKDK